MKKRSFTRYDTNIGAQYCSESTGGWKPCTVTKLSRKGMGVNFLANEAPSLGSLLQFKLSTAKESEYLNLRGAVKWIESVDNGYIGGIELCEVVDELQWLQLIYFIRNPLEKKRVIDIKTMPEQIALRSRTPLAPPPPKVIVPSTLEHIKNILNYKIL